MPSNLQNLQLSEEPSIEGLVVGIPKEYHCAGMSQEVVDIWTHVASLMEEQGAQVRIFWLIKEVFKLVISAQFTSNNTALYYHCYTYLIFSISILFIFHLNIFFCTPKRRG